MMFTNNFDKKNSSFCLENILKAIICNIQYKKKVWQISPIIYQTKFE